MDKYLVPPAERSVGESAVICCSGHFKEDQHILLCLMKDGCM